MTPADHPRRKDIDAYRAKAAYAVKMAEGWKGTPLGSDWERLGKTLTVMADDIERPSRNDRGKRQRQVQARVADRTNVKPAMTGEPRIFRDGKVWIAIGPGFIDPVVSVIGTGSTPLDAYHAWVNDAVRNPERLTGPVPAFEAFKIEQ